MKRVFSTDHIYIIKHAVKIETEAEEGPTTGSISGNSIAKNTVKAEIVD
jgi:hypothetical protein